jgi:hypothetical protein
MVLFLNKLLDTVGYATTNDATTNDATTNDATTNECYNEQFLLIKSGCYNENRCYNEHGGP